MASASKDVTCRIVLGSFAGVFVIIFLWRRLLRRQPPTMKPPLKLPVQSPPRTVSGPSPLQQRIGRCKFPLTKFTTQKMDFPDVKCHVSIALVIDAIDKLPEPRAKPLQELPVQSPPLTVSRPFHLRQLIDASRFPSIEFASRNVAIPWFKGQVSLAMVINAVKKPDRAK